MGWQHTLNRLAVLIAKVCYARVSGFSILGHHDLQIKALIKFIHAYHQWDPVVILVAAKHMYGYIQRVTRVNLIVHQGCSFPANSHKYVWIGINRRYLFNIWCLFILFILYIWCCLYYLFIIWCCLYYLFIIWCCLYGEHLTMSC